MNFKPSTMTFSIFFTWISTARQSGQEIFLFVVAAEMMLRLKSRAVQVMLQLCVFNLRIIISCVVHWAGSRYYYNKRRPCMRSTHLNLMCTMHYSYFFGPVKKYLLALWQEHWGITKSRRIHPDVCWCLVLQLAQQRDWSWPVGTYSPLFYVRM